MVKLAPENRLRAVGRQGNRTVEDEVSYLYQTEKWSKPARLQLREIGRQGDLVTLETQLHDEKGLLCLDARNQVRFELAGDGTLMDDLGTNTASRVVELYNGRALIRVKRNAGKSQVSVSSRELPSAFLDV
jgi:beta-galactosidase